jgi:hypothetical protein
MIDLAASTSGWSTASDRTAREQECGEPPSVCGGPQPWRNLAPIVCPRSFSSQEMPTLLTMLPFPTAFGPEAADFRSAIEPSAVRGAADAPLEGPAHPLMGQDRCLSFMIRYGTTSKPSRQEACSWRTPSCMSASWTQQQYNLLSRLASTTRAVASRRQYAASLDFHATEFTSRCVGCQTNQSASEHPSHVIE